MTYSELVKTLRPLNASHRDLTRDDPRLFEALGEVGAACRDHGLPTLTALVVRSADRAPGAGYYHMFHPEAGNDPSRRREAWERELERVRSTEYPASFQQELPFGQPEPPDDRHGSRQLGILRVAEASQKPGTVFAGLVTCLRCTQSFEIEVQKNPNAMTEKQPTFLILPMKGSPSSGPSGHLFIGTILSSPVLYYGSVKHCNHEQRVSVFFNRALRDRTDAHLIIMPSTSKAANPGAQ
jgi:hypothetical protein